LWDVATGRVLHALPGNGKSIPVKLSFTPDGGRLIALGKDGRVTVWETTGGRGVTSWLPPEAGAVPKREGRGVTGWAIAPDGQHLALKIEFSRVQNDGALSQIVVCETWTAKVVQRIKAPPDVLFALAFAPNGRLLASAGWWQDLTVRLWDVGTGQELIAFPGHRGAVRGLTFSPDGQRLVSASEDSTALVWDVGDVRPSRP
jgi:WD40 repeat protein